MEAHVSLRFGVPKLAVPSTAGVRYAVDTAYKFFNSPLKLVADENAHLNALVFTIKTSKEINKILVKGAKEGRRVGMLRIYKGEKRAHSMRRFYSMVRVGA